jgi:hypothetical protein
VQQSHFGDLFADLASSTNGGPTVPQLRYALHAAPATGRSLTTFEYQQEILAQLDRFSTLPVFLTGIARNGSKPVPCRTEIFRDLLKSKAASFDC